MTVTRRLMLPGTFAVKLTATTPDSITSAISRGDHIVLTAVPLFDVNGYDDDDILDDASIYTGVITKNPSPTDIAGHGLEWYLGTPKGYGIGTAGAQGLLTTAVTGTTATLSTWITALLPPSITAGTVDNTGLATLTNTYQGMTRREAITNVCELVGAEWRINPNGTLDAEDPATLFRSTPEVIVTRKPEGADSGLTGLNGSTIVTSVDVDDFVSKAVVVTKGTGSAATATTVSGSTSLVDLFGNTIHVERYIDVPDALAANATTIGNAALAKFNAERRDLTLRSTTYDVTRAVEPGDTVWVWDPSAGLVDDANEVMFRGEAISPIALRVTGMTFPIERGMGVYCRHSDGSYTDLTDHVAWESGDVAWEVGAPRRKLLGSPAEYREASAAQLGTNPTVAARLAGGARETWSPVITQGGTVNVTWARATVKKVDREVTFDAVGTVNASAGSPVAGDQIVVTLPYEAASSGHVIAGAGLIYDNSPTAKNYTGVPYLASTTAVGIAPDNAAGLLGDVGSFTAALANGDLIQIAGVYEADA